eukprot:840073-Rhodomonas_salina.1
MPCDSVLGEEATIKHEIKVLLAQMRGGDGSSVCVGFRVEGEGSRVDGSGYVVQGSGFRVQGSAGLRVGEAHAAVPRTQTSPLCTLGAAVLVLDQHGSAARNQINEIKKAVQDVWRFALTLLYVDQIRLAPWHLAAQECGAASR